MSCSNCILEREAKSEHLITCILSSIVAYFSLQQSICGTMKIQLFMTMNTLHDACCFEFRVVFSPVLCPSLPFYLFISYYYCAIRRRCVWEERFTSAFCILVHIPLRFYPRTGPGVVSVSDQCVKVPFYFMMSLLDRKSSFHGSITGFK